MVSLKVDTNPDFKGRLIEQDILDQSGSQPIYLSRIEINGGETFSYQFFNKLLSPLVDNSDYTFSQLVTNIQSTRSNLLNTGVFKNVDVNLQPDYFINYPQQIKSYNNEKSIPTKLTFDLSSINLNINEGFFNFNNEEMLNLNLNHLNNNFNENAELVSIGVDYNPYKPYDVLLTNGKFISSLKNPLFKFLIDLNVGQSNNLNWGNFKSKILSGKLGLLYKKEQFDIFNGFQINKKNLYDIEDDDIKFFTGDFLKTSVLNNVNYSNVSYINTLTKNFPTNGIKFNINIELSSIQENSNNLNGGEFFKSSINANIYKSLFNNLLTTHFETDFGFIYSFSKFPIHPTDKFYLGGFNSFIGFNKNSVEPKGGLQFYKVQSTFYTKVPSLLYKANGFAHEANPLRLYATAIIGNVSNNIFKDESGALSYGLGLRYFNHWANFDLGYYISNRFGYQQDNTQGLRNGIQFSISIGGSNRNT
ncbi:unnamed protein product [Candida verbasci]|uniref:Bacterial surface antigen (D15) domain-containing protein n=1 Tax=Candida verbasci TaxID=1227364 RepID=A0A9W4XC36_9ASCO|nr:unnamed protein product [Candida verbasci]